jgi:5-methylcytosine-specific restriction enzyme A
MATRNPPWSRDELIVTLDFYLRHRPTIAGQTSDELSKLSQELRVLQSRLGGEVNEKFRNENGVNMKIGNFMSLDPEHQGEGLPNIGKNDRVVWDEFGHRPEELERLSSTIRSFIHSDTPIPPKEVISDDEEEGEEGQILTRTHHYRERDTKLVKRKKEKVLKEKGTLVCEVCEFDFVEKYGDRGEGFIECHHTKPVSELEVGEKTKISDLSLVCPNCHRMIHKKRPWLSVEELRKLVKR